MRLIDADRFEKLLQNLIDAGEYDEGIISVLTKFPTAFDIDKVLKELEMREDWRNNRAEYYDSIGLKDMREYNSGLANSYMDAINIVKEAVK